MKLFSNKKFYSVIALTMALTTAAALTGCSGNSESASKSTTVKATEAATQAESTAAAETKSALTEDSIKTNKSYSDSSDGGHAITVDGEDKSYSNISVTKTGEADGDEADFYGENSAIFATNKATLDLSDIVVKTDGTHANAVFTYGEDTTVNISDSYIETSGNCSGGLMTTGGGTTNAENLTVTTSGNSSAAIRSDRGGGTMNVNGGSYTTSGVGSPVIYSTADVTVSNADMESKASQGVVVEGKNSVTLNNVNLTADNNKKNGSHSSCYQAVMIYQSMSGDASQGLSEFEMNDSKLTNKNGDIFFVTNTATEINLKNSEITNEGDGIFLRAAAAGWGSEGSNGGQVTLNASNQTIDGDIIVDSVSNLNLYLKDGSAFTGAINPDGADGDVYVELEKGSTWTLTDDCYITSLTCSEDSVNLNGHTLYVNGKKYTSGTASSGNAIEIEVSESSSHGDGQSPPDGKPGDGGTPPEKPNN